MENLKFKPEQFVRLHSLLAAPQAVPSEFTSTGNLAEGPGPTRMLNGQLAAVVQSVGNAHGPGLQGHGCTEQFYMVVLIVDERAVRQHNDPHSSFLATKTHKVMCIDSRNMALACQYCFKSDPSITLQVCGKCRVAPYCGKECQRKDWKRHNIGECFQMGHSRGVLKLPLYEAATRGDLKTVKRLVREGADVNKATAAKSTALSVASAYGYREIVAFLVMSKADLNEVDADGATALLRACSAGHEAIATTLVNYNADVNKASLRGFTPLYVASFRGNQVIVEILARHKADVNRMDAGETSPIAAALQEGHLGIVRWLLEHGADKGDLDVRYSDSTTSLLRAALRGDMSATKFLVQQGADVNVQRSDRINALISSAEKGHMSVVKYLTRHAANVNATDIRGWAPIHCAAENNHIDIARHLLQHGADVNAATIVPVRSTPLMLAIKARPNQLPMIELLVEQRADTDAADEFGWTPLHIAAHKGTLAVVKYLVQHGAGLDKRTCNGQTPLNLASGNDLLVYSFLNDMRFECSTVPYVRDHEIAE